ncbi:MAG: nickel insertion protein, partial [Nitrospirota bacterium]
MGAHLHFDCYSGISGDMTLGALVDVGVPFSGLVSGLKRL